MLLIHLKKQTFLCIIIKNSPGQSLFLTFFINRIHIAIEKKSQFFYRMKILPFFNILKIPLCPQMN